LREDAKRLK
jgi:hypothetical protein